MSFHKYTVHINTITTLNITITISTNARYNIKGDNNKNMGYTTDILSMLNARFGCSILRVCLKKQIVKLGKIL